jgi:hypothetical protein
LNSAAPAFTFFGPRGTQQSELFNWRSFTPDANNVMNIGPAGVQDSLGSTINFAGANEWAPKVGASNSFDFGSDSDFGNTTMGGYDSLGIDPTLEWGAGEEPPAPQQPGRCTACGGGQSSKWLGPGPFTLIAASMKSGDPPKSIVWQKIAQLVTCNWRGWMGCLRGVGAAASAAFAALGIECAGALALTWALENRILAWMDKESLINFSGALILDSWMGFWSDVWGWIWGDPPAHKYENAADLAGERWFHAGACRVFIQCLGLYARQMIRWACALANCWIYNEMIAGMDACSSSYGCPQLGLQACTPQTTPPGYPCSDSGLDNCIKYLRDLGESAWATGALIGMICGLFSGAWWERILKFIGQGWIGERLRPQNRPGSSGQTQGQHWLF